MKQAATPIYVECSSFEAMSPHPDAQRERRNFTALTVNYKLRLLKEIRKVHIVALSLKIKKLTYNISF